MMAEVGSLLSEFLDAALQVALVAAAFISLWFVGNKMVAGLWFGQLANLAGAALYASHEMYLAIALPLGMAVLYERARRRWKAAP